MKIFNHEGYIPHTTITAINNILNKPLFKNFDINKLYYIIDIILSANHIDSNNFTIINAKYLRNALGRNYTKYIKLLLDDNIITCNNYYNHSKLRPTEKSISLGYKLNIKIDSEYTKYTCKLNNRIEKTNNDFTILFNSKNNHTQKTIDLLNKRVVKHVNFHIDGFKAISNDNLPTNSYHGVINHSNRIANKTVNLKYSNNNRISSSYILIKKEYRKYIYYWNGIKPVYFDTLDMVSAQMTILSSLLNVKSPFHDIIHKGDIYDYLETELRKFPTYFYTERNGLKYKSIICKTSDLNRKIIKELLFSSLFSAFKSNNSVNHIFKQLFPEIITDTKRIIKAYRKNLITNVSDGTVLALILQTKESDLFNKITNTCLKNHLIVIPQYDGLLYLPHQKEQVLKIVNDEFKKQEIFLNLHFDENNLKLNKFNSDLLSDVNSLVYELNNQYTSKIINKYISIFLNYNLKSIDLFLNVLTILNQLSVNIDMNDFLIQFQLKLNLSDLNVDINNCDINEIYTNYLTGMYKDVIDTTKDDSNHYLNIFNNLENIYYNIILTLLYTDNKKLMKNRYIRYSNWINTS